MRAHVFDNEAAAQRLADALSEEWAERHGGVPLPRIEDASVGGRRIGPGSHGPWPTTDAYTVPRKHPTQDRWAVVHDDFVEARAGARRTVRGTVVEVPASDNASELGAEWFPDELLGAEEL